MEAFSFGVKWDRFGISTTMLLGEKWTFLRVPTCLFVMISRVEYFPCTWVYELTIWIFFLPGLCCFPRLCRVLSFFVPKERRPFFFGHVWRRTLTSPSMGFHWKVIDKVIGICIDEFKVTCLFYWKQRFSCALLFIDFCDNINGGGQKPVIHFSFHWRLVSQAWWTLCFCHPNIQVLVYNKISSLIYTEIRWWQTTKQY